MKGKVETKVPLEVMAPLSFIFEEILFTELFFG
jgi:hypothetical protein